MGNTLPSTSKKNVGTNVSIEFKKEELFIEQGKRDKRHMTYLIGKSAIEFCLDTTYDKNGLITDIRFHILKPRYISFYIRVDDRNYVTSVQLDRFREINFGNEIKNRWGSVTNTDVAYGMSENEGSLFVLQQKKRQNTSNFKKYDYYPRPFETTVAHYYAINSQRRNFIIRQKKYEVGLSIAVDIRVVNNALDLSWKGPSEHPSSALFEMFQQVSRTWIWKWTACPHCAAQTHMQQFQTDTENGDEEQNHLHQAGGCITINNPGVVNGNNNGNLIVKKLFFLKQICQET